MNFLYQVWNELVLFFSSLIKLNSDTKPLSSSAQSYHSDEFTEVEKSTCEDLSESSEKQAELSAKKSVQEHVQEEVLKLQASEGFQKLKKNDFIKSQEFLAKFKALEIKKQELLLEKEQTLSKAKESYSELVVSESLVEYNSSPTNTFEDFSFLKKSPLKHKNKIQDISTVQLYEDEIQKKRERIKQEKEALRLEQELIEKKRLELIQAKEALEQAEKERIAAEKKRQQEQAQRERIAAEKKRHQEQAERERIEAEKRRQQEQAQRDRIAAEQKEQQELAERKRNEAKQKLLSLGLNDENLKVEYDVFKGFISREFLNYRLQNDCYYFLHYYSKKILDAISDNDAWWLNKNINPIVWHFKDGKNRGLAKLLAFSLICFKDELGIEINRDTYICVIPASEYAANITRNEGFLEDVCDIINISNGFDLIERYSDRESSMSAGKGNVDVLEGLEFSDELEGKTIVLFDDVITRGTSMNRMSCHLKELGCKKVVRICLAETVSINDVEPRIENYIQNDKKFLSVLENIRNF